MAIARVFDGKGWTTGQYDELMKRLVDQLDLAPGESAPGVLFHWAAATDEGIRAVDVYASQEVADTLVTSSIGPIATDMGLPLPDIQQYEVHNLLRS